MVRGRASSPDQLAYEGEREIAREEKQQDSITVSGHSAWATPTTRSARLACPAAVMSSAPNQAVRASSTATAPAHTAGRSPHGTSGPRRQAPAGHSAIPPNPIDAQMAC
jgi:hypothetical protein